MKSKSEMLCGKKWISWCRLFLLGIVTLLCFMEAVRHAENLKDQLWVFHFTACGQQGGMDPSGARLAQEQNLKQEMPLEFVNWTQADGIQITAPALGTMEECAALLLCGRSDLLFPGYAVLDMEIQDSCLISSTLSAKLFGGADTRGLTVEVQGWPLEVLDVIDSEEAFLAYEAGENDVCLLDRAAVRSVPEGPGNVAERYQQLCGEWERMEDRALVWITQGMCFLIPFILWIFLIRYFREAARQADMAAASTNEACGVDGNLDRPNVRFMSLGDTRYHRMEKIIWRIFSYLLLAGGILLLIQWIRIPEDMIPAKWSDFEFWSEYGKRLGTACQALIRSEKKIPDLPVMGEFVRALLWAAGAVAGEAVFLRGFWRM